MGPHLGRVPGDEDRHIAEDPDTHLTRPFTQRGPLPEEEELAELDEVDLLPVLLHPTDKRLRLTHRERPRPFVPGCAVKAVPDRSKEGVVRQPMTVLLSKGRELAHQLGGLGVAKTEVGAPQQTDLERFDLVVLDPLSGEVRHLGHLRIGEDTVLDQQIGAEEELVSGKGGYRRVRRIPGTGRVQRQHLPPRRAGAGQPLHVGRGGRSEVTDPVSGRQGGGMENDPGGSIVLH